MCDTARYGALLTNSEEPLSWFLPSLFSLHASTKIDSCPKKVATSWGGRCAWLSSSSTVDRDSIRRRISSRRSSKSRGRLWMSFTPNTAGQHGESIKMCEIQLRAALEQVLEHYKTHHLTAPKQPPAKSKSKRDRGDFFDSIDPFRTFLAGSKSEADQCDCPTSSARMILRYRHANPSHGWCDCFDRSV